MNLKLNLNKFWQENEICLNFKNENRPRIPIHFWLDDHFLLEELNPPSTIRYYQEYGYKLKLHKIINKKLEKYLGKTFYTEDRVEEPVPNRFEVIMGAEWQYKEGSTPWLESKIKDIADLKKLITGIKKLDMSREVFPEKWKEKNELYEKETGKKL